MEKRVVEIVEMFGSGENRYYVVSTCDSAGSRFARVAADDVPDLEERLQDAPWQQALGRVLRRLEPLMAREIEPGVYEKIDAPHFPLITRIQIEEEIAKG